MKILISNDDGINARGIKVLAHRLAKDFDVYVVAPDRERSATGHALTLHKPLRVDEVDLISGVKGAWCTSGTPSDCVLLGKGALMSSPPDIVVSGINAGANLGSEVLYSGTVSAAMEGAILGIPSLAVSLVGHKHFETAAEIVALMLEIVPTLQLPQGTLLNVNVPNLPLNELKGISICELGIRNYNTSFEKRLDPRSRVYYWLVGEVMQEKSSTTTDVWAISNGYVSVTPVTFNMTDRNTLSKLSDSTVFKNAFNNKIGDICVKAVPEAFSKE